MSVLVLALVNAVLFGVLAVAALRASRAERSDRIRDLWRVLALATSLIALGSVRRAFVRASRLEWVSSDVEEFLLGDFVWAQSVATAGVGLLAWLAIRRAGRPRYEAEEFVSRLVRRVELVDLDGLVLSPREAAVLAVIGRGVTDSKEIANELTINVETVRSHVQRIYDKSGLNNRWDLVALSVRMDVSERFHPQR